MYMYARHTPHTSTCTCMQGTHHTHQHVHVCKAHTTHINMYMYASHTHQHVHVCKAHTTHINMYMYASHTPHTSTCTCMQGTQTHKHTNSERLFLACAIFPLLFPLHPITHTLATEDLRLSLHLFQTHSPVPTKSSNFFKHIGPHDALAASLDADGRHRGNVEMFCPHTGGWVKEKWEHEYFSEIVLLFHVCIILSMWYATSI